MKKIYFAGSIRGGRALAERYQKMIALLNQHGKVLTEHVGNPDVFVLEKHQTDEDIYLQDTKWIQECDIVVAECTLPSLGVGYELHYAEALGKPCHLFYDTTQAHLSAMLIGNKYFHLHPYSTEEELMSALIPI